MSTHARAFGAQSFHLARPRTEPAGIDRWYLEQAKLRLAKIALVTRVDGRTAAAVGFYNLAAGRYLPPSPDHGDVMTWGLG